MKRIPSAPRAPRAPRPRRRGPSSAPRRPRAARPAGVSTPSTAALKAEPRKANWIRCWGRTSVFAPQSRKRSGGAVRSGNRDLDGERRPVDTLGALEGEEGRGHRRAGRAGADQRAARRRRRPPPRRGRPRPPASSARPPPARPRCRSTRWSGRARPRRGLRGRLGPKMRTGMPSAAASRAPSSTSSGPPSAP